jgi:hypothetical protein
MKGAEALRVLPKTHSAYAVTESLRGWPDRFSTVSREILTGSSGVTYWSSSSAMPCESCSNRL